MGVAILGCIVGCTVGLLFSKLLYDNLITAHYVYAVWSVPFMQLGIVVFMVMVATGIAIYSSTKHMRSLAITETINEL